MYKCIKKTLVVGILGVFLFSAQGCDQIKKFTDYLSPKASQPKEKTVVQVPAVEATVEVAAEAVPASTSQEEPLPANVLAKVGEWTMTIDEFNKRMDVVKEAVPEFDAGNVEQKKYILSELVQQQLLAQEAVDKGVDKTEEYAAAIKDFRNTLLVQLLGVQLTKGLVVSDEEAQQFYNDNPDFFKKLTEWKVREIVVASEQEAKDIAASLNQGAAFEETAKTKSIGKSAANGGDLGFLTMPTGDPALDQNVFSFEKMAQIVSALDAGSVSGVFKGPEGFYVVKLEETRGGEIQALEEIKEDLKKYIIANKQQQILIETLTAAQAKYKVNINENLLEE